MYNAIPLLRQLKTENTRVLRTLFARSQKFLLSFSTPTLPLIRNPLKDFKKRFLLQRLDSETVGIKVRVLL